VSTGLIVVFAGRCGAYSAPSMSLGFWVERVQYVISTISSTTSPCLPTPPAACARVCYSCLAICSCLSLTLSNLSRDTPRVIILPPTNNPTPSPFSYGSPSLIAADFSTSCLNNLASRVIASCAAITSSSARAFSRWVASGDWVSCKWFEVAERG